MSVYKRFKGKRINHGAKDYDKGTWYVSKRIRGELLHKAIPEVKTKKEAIEVADKLISDIKARRYGLQREAGFQEFANGNYLRYCEQNNESFYTKELFVKEFNKHFGKMKLSEITPQDCRDYQYKRLHTPVKGGGRRKNGSVNRETNALSKLFSLACEQGLLQDSPMRWVKKLESDPPRRRSLTAEQRKALWAELEKDIVLMRLVTLAFNLPLRRGQLLAIRPSDVDVEESILWATKSKGKQSRAVPLNDTALFTLKMMIQDGQLPFPVKRFEKRWWAALEDAGINKKDGTRETNFHFHDLRHVFGSELLKRGVNPYHIKELFGHTDMKTSAIYLSSEMAELSEAVRRLDPVELEGIN